MCKVFIKYLIKCQLKNFAHQFKVRGNDSTLRTVFESKVKI